MTQTQFPEPRIEAELTPSLRLEPDLPLPVTIAREAASPAPLILSGIGVLCVGGAALGAVHLIVAAFAASLLLGWSTAGIAVLGFGLIGAGMVRELRGLWGLAHVDRLRAALASADRGRVRDAALAWAATMPDGPTLIPALSVTDDSVAIRALLDAGPGAGLRARTDALSNVASLQILAAIAAIPSPALDGALVAWRGIRLVRQVAELHGLRPGALATIALLRRTLLSAALVTATDIAANTAAHALFSNKLLGHIAGDTATALVAARRMRLLARAAAAACTPL